MKRLLAAFAAALMLLSACSAPPPEPEPEPEGTGLTREDGMTVNLHIGGEPSSIDPAFTTTVGLCAANAMVALSGGLLVQYQKFSDISLGTGMVVIGLASLIIGEVVMGRRSVVRGIAAALVGAVIYRIIIATALVSTKVGAQNFKLVSAVIVAAAISWPAIREKLRFYQLRREVERNG